LKYTAEGGKGDRKQMTNLVAMGILTRARKNASAEKDPVRKKTKSKPGAMG